MGLSILSPLTSLFGGAEKRPAPVQTPAAVEPAQKTPSEIAAEEEQRRKAALVAANASGGAGQTTVGGGNADVTRRLLLGL